MLKVQTVQSTKVKRTRVTFISTLHAHNIGVYRKVSWFGQLQGIPIAVSLRSNLHISINVLPQAINLIIVDNIVNIRRLLVILYRK